MILITQVIQNQRAVKIKKRNLTESVENLCESVSDLVNLMPLVNLSKVCAIHFNVNYKNLSNTSNQSPKILNARRAYYYISQSVKLGSGYLPTRKEIGAVLDVSKDTASRHVLTANSSYLSNEDFRKEVSQVKDKFTLI